VLGHYAARTDLQDAFDLVYDGSGGSMDIVIRGTIDILGYESKPILDHFDITADEAYELFSTHGCGEAMTDRQKAIDYIRDFIDRHEDKVQA
jgi:hypothetical protein